MSSNFFIPKSINIGYQNRNDTYTGKLAYIIYFDAKNVLRKEASWNSWRDKSIPNDIVDNVPTDGFVLNKKVGGYDTGWNHRQTYTRIYDPRGFEFEITIENLLYILENATSTKGKGLEGQFVYGWSGKDLILIPCDAPDYKELEELNNKRHEAKNFKGKDLIIGATYLSKDNEELIYMGRYDYHGHYSYKKAYFFYNKSDDDFTNYSSISNLLIDCIDDKCYFDYANLFSRFEYYEHYNPYDFSKDEYIEYTLEEFVNHIDSYYNKGEGYYSKKYQIEHNDYVKVKYYLSNKLEKENKIYSSYEINESNYLDHYKSTLHDKYWSDGKLYETCYYAKDNVFKWEITTKIKEENTNTYYSWNRYRYIDKKENYQCSVNDFVKDFKPCWKKEYLKDGKVRGGYKND